jgi:hypothetical protein
MIHGTRNIRTAVRYGIIHLGVLGSIELTENKASRITVRVMEITLSGIVSLYISQKYVHQRHDK